MLEANWFKTPTRLAAALLCALTTVAASAADQVNGSGATLFFDFFTKPASTNDYIDVDNNGVSGFNGGFPQNLAPSATSYNPVVDAPGTVWNFNYRGVGSGNGLAEFVDYQLLGTLPSTVTTEGGIYNSVVYYDPVSGPAGYGAGPTYSPNVQTSIDFATMDVPTKWFVTQSGTAHWNANPTTPGYGNNAAVSTTGQGNKLKSLQRGALSLNTNTASPDANTVFDNPIAWVPIGYIANRGADVENIEMSDLQHLMTTGRDSNGVNLVVVTRDSGSGTRNGAMNSIGVDPSWGVGDNDGPKNSAEVNTQLGSTFTPSNQGGSSLMEAVVQNSRLAIGYTGLLGGSRAIADANAEKYEVVNIRKDVEDGQATGATTFVRPTDITVVTRNGDINTGWQIGGPETMATLGDVYQTDSGAVDYVDNQAAAAYVRNILESIANVISLPGDVDNVGLPGELLTSLYTLSAGIEYSPDQTNPDVFTATVGFNSAVRDLIEATNTQVLEAWGDSAGLVPTRSTPTGATFTDGQDAADNSYVTLGGAGLTYGNALNVRNTVAGDFNGDLARTTSDIAGMVKMYEYDQGIIAGGRAAAATDSAFAGMAGSAADMSPEIIGDFNGDGDFDLDDVRYGADGLFASAALNRKANFMAVDNASTSGNLFATTLAHGTYDAGDSRGDIAGSLTGPAKGSAPSGADGIVDAKDIDYVFAQFVGLDVDSSGGVEWANLDEAVFADLSADMTGDLVINQSDVDELVEVILETAYGDSNLDGVVNLADLQILGDNWQSSAAGWATADFTGDGVVNLADLQILGDNWGFGVVPDLSFDEALAGVGLAIPEPTSLMLLGVGLVALYRRAPRA